MATTKSYQKLIKLAKKNQIQTIEELEDLISGPEMKEEIITGADFEVAKKQLKLKQ